MQDLSILEQIFIIIWRLNACVRPNCVHIERTELLPLGPGPAWYFYVADITVSLEVGSSWCKPVLISVPYCSMHAHETPRSPATSCPHTLPCFLQLGTLCSRADSPPTPSPACCLWLQMWRVSAVCRLTVDTGHICSFFFSAPALREPLTWGEPTVAATSPLRISPALAASDSCLHWPTFFFSQKYSNCCYYVLRITENGWRRRTLAEKEGSSVFAFWVNV